jgi:hypothetical protein
VGHGWQLLFSLAERLQERRAPSFQPLLQPRTAVTIAARPWFFTLLVATVAAIVCVLHSLDIKVLFPIRPLLQERRGTITDFDPTHRSGLDARIAHIAQVLAPGHGALAKLFTLDGFKKTVCTKPGLTQA